MNPPNPLSRRSFIRKATAASAFVAAPQILSSSVLGREGYTAPSERIRVGFIGIGQHGFDWNLPPYLSSVLSAQTASLQSCRFSLMIDPQSVRLAIGDTTLLECRGMELINDAGATLPVEVVSVVKKDKGALQTLKAGDALIERQFMPMDGGFHVEEKFTKLPSSALNRWYSSYGPIH